MKSKGSSPGFPIGAVSLLGAFVILSLLAFAMLAYTTAENDFVLAEDTAAAVEDYYTARNSLEADMAQALELWSSGNYEAVEEMGIEVREQGGQRVFTLERPVDQRRDLVCQVTLRESGDFEKKIYIVTE